MKQAVLTVLMVVGGAWALTLGTVAVVEFGRAVDVLAAVTAAPPIGAPAGFEALPVEWNSGDTRSIASALRYIGSAILAVN